jgi:uncharacterized protein
LIPRIKAGDRDGAVEGAVEQVVTALGGKLAAAPSQQPVSPNSLQVIFAAVVIVVLVILGFRYPAFGYYLLMILSTMMRRGGGGGSDAGVGGGRSGGGGAGGKW